ncbi:MAG: succinyl-diaminopimelate desuccinylase [Gammaproteobacteria bacterium]|nr:succinyl-diaminopimelate desuccinylase [Gammaproteobacteria bacterium]
MNNLKINKLINLQRNSTKTNSLTFNDQRLLGHLSELIKRPSVTPYDAGCTDYLSQQLTAYGFETETFTLNGVTNLIAKTGKGKKTLAFVGHTDVVPPGNEEQWQHAPYSAHISDGIIWGRGSVDMKSGLSCMLDATQQFLESGNSFDDYQFYWLVTSDEEGEAEYGTRAIVHYLQKKNITIDACIVGEPSASRSCGDTVKVGRRGAISGSISIKGKVGHVAYPQQIDNPIHHMGYVISQLNAIEWDSGSLDFPGTSLQITHIDSGQFTDNVSPAECKIHFNIRYSHNWCETSLNALIKKQLASINCQYDITFDRPCQPYLTPMESPKTSLLNVIESAIIKTTGRYPLLSTSGGTSDGRFVAQLGADVYELGIPNKTIHQINERAEIEDIVQLRDIYVEILKHYA